MDLTLLGMATSSSPQSLKQEFSMRSRRESGSKTTCRSFSHRQNADPPSTLTLLGRSPFLCQRTRTSYPRLFRGRPGDGARQALSAQFQVVLGFSSRVAVSSCSGWRCSRIRATRASKSSRSAGSPAANGMPRRRGLRSPAPRKVLRRTRARSRRRPDIQSPSA